MPSTQMTERHVHIFYETLAFILSEKYGIEITITVTKKDEFKNEEYKEEEGA